ncbi:Zinc finger RING/FYVE/PHD-type [Penicillium lagena]|uniref:Zinc finger RING/FYVE/PHD-type n=1 Tax=Penicillium lagena TaxID=94218 RepID=UPI002541A1F7|nr:Zinc finger RING/FYVE/PHD-type [Penicillium lagena]KAJ5612501.1 Zinc finger RING/FYVE/PHD-type [Penicillium lagena]
MVHDSKFPGDEVPPLPHSSTWFSHLEDLHTQSSQHRNTSTSQAQARRSRKRAHSVDSDDIAIERERISLKCPLTLLDFRDPVTSTKCPHSFERAAITDMISRSNSYAPAGGSAGGRRVRIVKCPVCDIPLSLADLRADPVLLRRVRRVQERAGDEDEDGDGGRDESASHGGLLLTSDGPNGGDEDVDVDLDGEDQREERESAAAAAVRIKSERRSVAPEQRSVSSEQMKVEGMEDSNDEADGSSEEEDGRTDSSDE